MRETVQLVVVGASYNSAPVSVRERLTVPSDSLPRVLAELRESVAEVLVLSTCNRVELYAVCGHESSGAELLRQFFASRADLAARTVRAATYAHGHHAAVRHLFRVAAGLDSMVVGESEILGQVRRAIETARTAGTVGPVLDRLGDAAVACGRRTRAMTSLGSDGQSVASVAVRLAAREVNGLEQRNVLVLGAGDTARSTLGALGTIPDVRVTLVNRTHDRALELAQKHGVETRRWEELNEALAVTDVVIACTSASTPIIDAAMLASARETDARPLLCVDLGLPRDVDPDVRSLTGVRLIDLDRIDQEAAATRGDNAHHIARAESMVDAETERFMDWWRGRGVASTITRLHAMAGKLRDAELERALARLPELDAHARTVVRDLATRMAAKLLHEPTLALKRDPEGPNMAVVVERLFALSDTADFASQSCPVDERADTATIHEESIVA